MDNLIPTPVVFPVARRVDLSEADDDPTHPHEHTMNLVFKTIVRSIIDELACTDRREQLIEISDIIIMIRQSWIAWVPSSDQRK